MLNSNKTDDAWTLEFIAQPRPTFLPHCLQDIIRDVDSSIDEEYLDDEDRCWDGEEEDQQQEGLQQAAGQVHTLSR